MDARILQALDLLHSAPNRRMGVSWLARAVGLSDSYFHHLFRQETGISPAKYLLDLKLSEAAHLIETTALPIKDVLSKVGATDPSHFIRQFRTAYGLTPSLYRRRTPSPSTEQQSREVALRATANGSSSRDR
jgi:transcriptional regulator GlxA family with amidase domain